MPKGKDKDAIPKPSPEIYKLLKPLPSAELGSAVGKLPEGILSLCGECSGKWPLKEEALNCRV